MSAEQFKVYSLAELMAMPPTRADWGPWRLDLKHMVIFVPSTGNDTDDHGQGFLYWIDLEDCRSSAQVLDGICQVKAKNWADDRTLAGLVRALDDLLHPQANLCSFGQDKTITPERIRERAHEVAKWAA